jgi:hypothetical protein
VSLNPSISRATSFTATNVTIEDSTFTGNGTVSFAGSQLGFGDISLTGFNGNATLRRVTVNGLAAANASFIGVQIRGQATSGTGTAPFFPAGTVVLEDLTITGGYRRPSAAASLPGAPSYGLYFQNYSDVSGISFSGVEIATTLAGHGLGTAGVGSTLDIGDTHFAVPTSVVHGGSPAFNIVNGSTAAIDATSATFGTLDTTVVADALVAADRVYDVVDLAGLGLVRLQPGKVHMPATGSLTRAIAAADAGDTVHMAAGTYADSMIALTKAITIAGAQAGVDARTRGAEGIPGQETVFTSTGRIFDLNAAGITIDGVKFADMSARALDSYANPNGFTLKNSILLSSNAGSFSGGAVQFGGGGSPAYTADDFTFERNYVRNIGGYMLYMGHVMRDGAIRDNTIVSAGFAFGPFGQPDGWVIEGNTFDGDVPGATSYVPGGAVGTYSGYGINAQFGDVIVRDNTVRRMNGGLGPISVVGGSITGNTFEDNYGAAFGLWGGEYGSPVSRNVTISNNLITYNGLSAASHGIRLRPSCATNGPCSDPTTPDASTIHVNTNRFVDLGVGTAGQVWAIRNDMAGLVDATGNVWGTIVPAEITAKIGKTATSTGSGQGTTTSPIAAWRDDPAKAGEPGFWPLDITYPTSDDTTNTGGTPSVETLAVAAPEIANPAVTFTLPAGETAVISVAEIYEPAGAKPFTVSGSTVFVEIVVTGGTGPYTVCLDGDPATDRLFHFVGGAWTDITDLALSTATTVCGQVDEFSPFALASFTDTATSVVPSVTSATYGDTVDLDVTVSGSADDGSGGSVDPTGTVDFYACVGATTPATCDDTTWVVLGSETLSGGTSGDGSATASLAAWAPGAGAYRVVAVYGGDAVYFGSASSATVTVAKAAQTITVTTAAPASADVLSTFPVAASASSGLDVAITTSGGCTGSGTNDATITMTSPPTTCTVRYDQAGDADYEAAPQVTSATASTRIAQTISFITPAPASATYFSTFTVVAGGGGSGTPVVISVTGGCSGSGQNTATIIMTSGTNDCAVRYSQAGTVDYTPAPTVTQLVQAQKAVTTTEITLATPAISVAGSPVRVFWTVDAAPATPTGTVTIRSANSPAASCTASVAARSCLITLTGAGTDTLTATYNGNANFATSSGTDTHVVTPAAVSQLQLSPAGSSVAANVGQAFTALGVDRFGNVVGDRTASASFRITNGTCALNVCKSTRAGTHTVTAVAGVARGTTTLRVTAGEATQLAFGRQPVQTRLNRVMSPAPTVRVLDEWGNLVTTSTATVTVRLANNPTGATLSGPLSVTAVGGVATFSGLSLNRVGAGYTLAAASPDFGAPVLFGATSTAFRIVP